MKKVILLLTFFLLVGCTNKVELSGNEISNNIPNNYELFGFYYENLDDDKENEVILLLQQDRSYITNTEEFKTLPVIIKVLDNKNGIWIASQDRKIEDYSNYFPPSSEENDKEAPYRIFSKNDNNWIVLKTQSRSFDSVANGVDIFSYDEDLGLFPVIFNNERKRQYALTSLIDKTDKIYLFSCNPWAILPRAISPIMENQLKIVAEVIDLSGQRPTISSMDLDIRCKMLEDEFGQMDRIEPSKLEKFLNNNDIYL